MKKPGCFRGGEEIAQIEGVDVVLGAKDKFKLLDLFDDFQLVITSA